MNNGIILSIGSVILMVLIYFAEVQRKKKHERVRRIDDVVSRYISLKRAGKADDYDGLFKAGAATLKSDQEIKEACNKIVQQGENHPLSNRKTLFASINLKQFFDYAVKNKINLSSVSVSIEDIISEYKRNL